MEYQQVKKIPACSLGFRLRPQHIDSEPMPIYVIIKRNKKQEACLCFVSGA